MLNFLKRLSRTKFAAGYIYLFLVQVSILIIMSLFRLGLYQACYNDIAEINDKWVFLFEALQRGLHFDLSVASSILAPPLIFLSILGLFNKFNKVIIYIINFYFIVIYTIVLGLISANIPYFKYFYRHINISILNWADYGQETSNMILEDSTNWFYIGIFFISIMLFSFLVITYSRLAFKIGKYNLIKKDYTYCIPILLLSYIICFFCIKGHVRKGGFLHPYDAYFCHNTVFNQLAINPVFYFYKSMTVDTADATTFVDEEVVRSVVRKELGFNLDDYNIVKTRGKEIQKDSLSAPNIVIILVESLSHEYLQIERNGKSITPYLHELIQKSYYFENFYSQGTHTNQGIVSSLYSFPAIFDKHLLKLIDINKISNDILFITQDEFQQKGTYPPIYQGLPQNLKDYDYQNFFFLTHHSRFDNIGTFLHSNGFDNVFAEENYPKAEIVNAWGISDSYLFKYALEQFNQYKTNTHNPFLGVILTISNHPPIYYPKEFENISPNEDERAIAYNDQCIQQFIEQASKENWYDNTIFLILGDHGKIIGKNPFDMPLSLNHIPLIIYSPLFENSPKRISKPAGQIDIYPTVMNLIDIPQKYNSFGTDILNNDREYIYFTSDDKIGSVSDKYLYVYNTLSNIDHLYSLENQNNVLSENKELTDSLKLHSFSMIEAAKYLFKNNLKQKK